MKFIYWSGHSIHPDDRLLSSSPQIEPPFEFSSEPSCLPWISAADQLFPPLDEPG